MTRAFPFAVALLLSAGLVIPAGAQQPLADSKWTLVWSDEFDGTRIDPEKWVLAEDCWGGGNNERQCYTSSQSNASVKGGKLIITALRQQTRGPAFSVDQRTDPAKAAATTAKPYSSARLSTKGKADWRFGRFEIRAKLPEGQGTWPAIWMLPSENHYGRWAASGEIDIMEAVNLGTPRAKGSTVAEDTILGTLHFGGEWPRNTQLSNTTALPHSPDGFNTFALDWSADRIDWSINGKRYASLTAADWSRQAAKDGPIASKPFDRAFHLILNLAIGGGLAEGRNLGGVSDDGFPKQMLVDWVRIYRCTALPATGPDSGKSCDP